MSDQLERNWDAFMASREELEDDHLGRTVLMHDGKIVSIYNDSGDAYAIGCEKFGLGNFSVETIGSQPKSLGCFTAYIPPQSAG